MLTLRQRLGVIIGGAVVLIALIIFGFWWSRRVPATTPVSAPVVIPAVSSGTPSAPVAKPQAALRFGEKPVSAPTNVNPEELYVRQLATIFVERFGTRSTQDSNRHITDVLGIVTPSMATWLRTQQAAASSTYVGVTVQALAANLEKREGDKATVTVGVQETTSQAGGNKITQRTGRVNLVKINGEWKVDGLYWQK